MLTALSADRQRLAQQVAVPWALMAAFGALGAWWVGSAASAAPGAHYEPPQSGWMALLGALVVVHLVQRETGIRFRSLGARELDGRGDRRGLPRAVQRLTGPRVAPAPVGRRRDQPRSVRPHDLPVRPRPAQRCGESGS